MKFIFDNNVHYSDNWKHKEKIGQLFFTHGLPRSGKDTFCSLWLSSQNYLIKDLLYSRCKELIYTCRRVVVCADDFRLAAYGKEYDHSCECMAAAAIFTAIKALLKTHCVLFNDTNSSEWSLRRIYEICPQAEYVNIGTEKRICLERNRKTKKISEFVFDRIERQLLEIEPEKIRKDYL